MCTIFINDPGHENTKVIQLSQNTVEKCMLILMGYTKRKK